MADRLETAGEAGLEVVAAQRVEARSPYLPLMDHAGLAQDLEVMRIELFLSDENQIGENSASGNGEDGLRVSADSLGNLLEHNRANGNGDDGIDVDSPATTLIKNAANDNGDFGIEAAGCNGRRRKQG